MGDINSDKGLACPVAAVWKNGVVTQLRGVQGTASQVVCMNASGALCGATWSGELATPYPNHGDYISLDPAPRNPHDIFVWRRGKSTRIDIDGSPSDMNNRGAIIGLCNHNYGTASQFDSGSFIWTGGKPLFLAMPGATWVRANGLNNSGVVVGGSLLHNAAEAFLWRNGTFSILKSVGKDNNEAHGINDAGVVVGQGEGPDHRTRACKWFRGRQTFLADLGGGDNSAVSVNSHGDIVGLVGVPVGHTEGQSTHVMLWKHDGKGFDLTRLVPDLLQVLNPAIAGFNDRGDIVVARLDSSLGECCYLLRAD